LDELKTLIKELGRQQTIQGWQQTIQGRKQDVISAVLSRRPAAILSDEEIQELNDANLSREHASSSSGLSQRRRPREADDTTVDDRPSQRSRQSSVGDHYTLAEVPLGITGRLRAVFGDLADNAMLHHFGRNPDCLPAALSAAIPDRFPNQRAVREAVVAYIVGFPVHSFILSTHNRCLGRQSRHPATTRRALFAAG
jgi:hypothetical protein